MRTCGDGMLRNLDVAVVGAGQAGLAMGHFLSSAGLHFVCLDGAERIGDTWRNRYDSLRLFTPAQYDSLPGLPFPAPHDHYPSKDEVAGYLQSYAERFRIPVRLGTRVERVLSSPDGFRLATSSGSVEARAVVVATGAYGSPAIPQLSHGLSPRVQQLHTSEYRRPDQLEPGTTVVVGAGNSGLQIAAQVAQSRRVVLARGSPQAVFPQRLFGRDIFYWFERLRFTDVPADSVPGRVFRRNEPVVGDGPRSLAQRLGLDLRPRVVGAEGTMLRFADGARLRVDAVIWATGYRNDYGWIDLPVLDARGAPLQKRGITSFPGMYFLGLHWMTGRGSSLLGWVGEDARRLLPAIRLHLGARK